MRSLLTLVLIVGFISSCSPKESPSAKIAQEKVQAVVVTNQNAKTLDEWHGSENNPEVVFSQWNAMMVQGKFDPTDICNALSQVPDENLDIFENEITAPKNDSLLKDCKQELSARLDSYWSEQRKQLPVNVNNIKNLQGSDQNFRFPDDVQTRDVSNGYFAVSGDLQRKEIVLTFDDGPHPKNTDSILASLEAVNAKAVFFELGMNVRANPTMSQHVAAHGHSIGSHSNTHLCLASKKICERSNGHMLSYAEALAEIQIGHQAVNDAVGWVEPFFRFPYGESSAELKNYLQKNGIGEFYWSIDSEDWKSQTNQHLLDNTLAQVDKLQRGIILMHDIQHRTAEILPQLLKELYFRGYSVVLLKASDAQARFNSKIVRLHSSKTLPSNAASGQGLPLH